MTEFMTAMKEVFPNLLVQFEDFSTDNAFKYLDKFRNTYKCFNDDVRIFSIICSSTYPTLYRHSVARHPFADDNLVDFLIFV